MGALREKMIVEMKLRNFAGRTQKSYLGVMVGLAKHYRQFPDQLTQEQIRAYLLHLQERGLSSSSQNVAVSGLKFFYQQVLGWNEKQLFLPPRKRLWRLPEVLSPREVEQLLICAVKLRDRCLLMTAYSSGLRVGELVHLKLSCIDPERMMIRVEQGKGKKDRYTILSQRLLGELKKYKQTYQPVSWVFFGKNRNCPLDISAAQKVYNLAKQKSGVEKAKASTPCAIVSRAGRCLSPLRGALREQTYRVSAAEHKVIRAVKVCRTEELGGHLYRCDACDFERPVYNSCRNRHCPKCQSLAKPGG